MKQPNDSFDDFLRVLDFGDETSLKKVVKCAQALTPPYIRNKKVEKNIPKWLATE